MRVRIFLISFISVTVARSNIGARIVGGQDIAIERVPYQVSVEHKGEHQCGGTIVAPKFVLGTARCFVEADTKLLQVRAGTTIREEGGQVLPVKNITSHPEYTADRKDNDIAVIELGSTIEFGFWAAQIALPAKTKIWPAGTDAVISGWGVGAYLSREKAKILQGATVQLVDWYTCQKTYGVLLKERMACAGVAEGGVDSCNYDFGGALQIDGVLAGIYSFGWGCADPGYPSIYVNITLVLDFIQSVINA